MSLNEKLAAQEPTTSNTMESTVNSDETESKCQESQKISNIKLSGPIAMAKLKEKKRLLRLLHQFKIILIRIRIILPKIPVKLQAKKLWIVFQKIMIMQVEREPKRQNHKKIQR